jgi:murein DD-endopeptidase MepM/ murein hydrolase activator NlpD
VHHRAAAIALLLAAALGASCRGPLTPEQFEASCTPAASGAGETQPFFQRPFAGEYRMGNPFDHDLPIIGHKNGYMLTTCGTRIDPDTDGHSGYDFIMPEGTPLSAVAAGEVIHAGLDEPRYCDVLGKTEQALYVAIGHRAPSGDIFASVYGHMSDIRVKPGDQVAAGAALGLSGNTGCSTRPHLHFDTYRKLQDPGLYITIDPYGWQGSGGDPWAAHPQGAPSVWLWDEGQAPRLFK